MGVTCRERERWGQRGNDLVPGEMTTGLSQLRGRERKPACPPGRAQNLPHPSRNTKALLKALRWEPPAPSPTPWESELAVDPCCSGTYSGRRPPGPQHSPHHGCRHCHHRGRVGGKAPKGLGWGPHGPGDAREQGPTPVASRSVGSHCQRARSSTGMQKGGGGPPASSLLRAGTPRTVETSGAPAHSLLRVVAWAGWV